MKRHTTLAGWLVMAAALVAGMAACSKVDDTIDEPATAETPKTYTLTVTATKGDDDATRALSLNDKTLNATWAVGDAVQVYHVLNPGRPDEMESIDTPDGTLYAKSNGSTSTLSGTITSGYTPRAGDVLRLRFLPYPDYTTQEGTLDYIATHCDYALAEITIASIDAEGVITATGTASFQNQQAIVKFSLKWPDGTSPLAATGLTVKVGRSTTYKVSLASAASDIFVAVPKVKDKDVTLTATDGTNFFGYERDHVSLGIGQYYAIGVNMEMTSINLSMLTTHYKAKDGDVLVGTLDGNTHPYKITIADGATVTLSNVTINGVSRDNYPWAGITCLGDATIVLAEGTTNTVKGFHQSFPGILPAVDKTLTIEGTGSLTVSSNGVGAGIGCGTSSMGGTFINSGNIHIKSGTINATGGASSAGIGSAAGNTAAFTSRCGTITISGGNVTATGGNYAAGIGCGYGNDSYSSCGAILIEGGTVTATAGRHAAAIGKGYAPSGGTTDCPKITFTTGITSLTLKNPTASGGGTSTYADCFLNAGQVMAGAVDITGSLNGYNGFVKYFNSRNPDFDALFPNSSFNESTLTWTIAP